MRGWTAFAAAGASALVGCAALGGGRPTTVLGTSSLSVADLLTRAQATTLQTDHQGLLESGTAYSGGWMSVRIRAYFRHPNLLRYEYLTGSLKGLVVAQGRGVAWRYDPQTRRVVLGAEPSVPEFLGVSLVERNYKAVVTGHPLVAGRTTEQVDLVSRSPHRPKRRFWIDSQKHVILGQERWDGDGKLLSESRFSEVEYRPEPDSLFVAPKTPVEVAEPTDMAKPYASVADLEHAVGYPVLLPRWLPRGYHEATHYLTRCEDGCGAAVALTRFTDGVDTFSLFQSPHMTDPQGGDCQIRKVGAVREVRIVKDKYDFVVVGDLDPLQLQKVILSIPTRPAR